LDRWQQCSPAAGSIDESLLVIHWIDGVHLLLKPAIAQTKYAVSKGPALNSVCDQQNGESMTAQILENLRLALPIQCGGPFIHK
jgi:hypothetical protein